MQILKLAILAGILVLIGLFWMEHKTVRVLAIGNSFSANALKYFSRIVRSSGSRAVSANAMIGGCDFERHMRHADAFETNPDDPEGSPYPGGKSLKDLLTKKKWDYVTIQQASAKSFKSETFHPHADRLIAYIKKYAPQAEIVIHQTWAYRDDHSFWGETNLNTDVMYKGLRAAYDGLAEETGFRLIPCGDAMEAARRDSVWGKFVPDAAFDPETAGYPALPKNEKRSLHNGYGWEKDPETGEYKLGKDATHANAHGEYLLGCVWFEFFFGQSVLGNSFVPSGVTAEDSSILQRIAHRVVTERQRPDPLP
jgi:hypothetical protein